MPDLGDIEIPRLLVRHWPGEPAVVYRPDAGVTVALDPGIAAFLAAEGPARLPAAELHRRLTAHLRMTADDTVRIDVLIDELSTRHLLTPIAREAGGTRPTDTQ